MGMAANSVDAGTLTEREAERLAFVAEQLRTVKDQAALNSREQTLRGEEVMAEDAAKEAKLRRERSEITLDVDRREETRAFEYVLDLQALRSALADRSHVLVVNRGKLPEPESTETIIEPPLADESDPVEITFERVAFG